MPKQKTMKIELRLDDTEIEIEEDDSSIVLEKLPIQPLILVKTPFISHRKTFFDFLSIS